jgi:hypothetical protein
MKHKFLGLLMGGLTLAATASPAMAAKVTLEIEGRSQVHAPITVQTPASVTKGGDTCANGASVLGTLDAGTGGDWAGVKYGLSGPDTIFGEFHSFDENNGNWVFVINGKTANDTACNTPVSDGDAVLWFWSSGVAPYKADAGYDDPVLLTATATAVPGQAFPVTVRDTETSFDSSYTGSTAITPSAGATVSGGNATVTTAADGTASVTVPAGTYSLVATKGNRAPARITGCATTGSDGYCGTTKTSTTTTTTTPTPTTGPCTTNGHDGLCGSPDKVAANAAITAVSEGKKFKKGSGPRQLGGHVANDPSGIADVQLRLTRNDKGACSTYDGKSEKFKVLKKCGAVNGTWFSVGAKQDFTYLLPSKLPRGRYVFDVQVVDKAGNKTEALARGTSRVVFFVA